MPLIGGNKYSCEPCIRGHRATHCTHTDRILIEVRKPGRPLDRCAHSIKTCSCSKHLSNTTIVSLNTSSTIKERSLSPPEDGDGGVKVVMISKEMPFARELRLSPTTTRSEDDDEDVKPLVSKRKALPTERKAKTTKRHRLDNNAVSPSESIRVDVTREQEREDELPALSPSISESGSEGSLPAYFDRREEREVFKIDKIPSVVFRGIAISDLLS